MDYIFMDYGFTVLNIFIATDFRYIDKHMPGKTKGTVMIDTDLWKRFRMIAILNEMEISGLVEEALREKLDRMKQLEQYPEYKDVQGLRLQKQPSQQQSQLPATATSSAVKKK